MSGGFDYARGMGPPPSEDERRLRMLENLIAEGREAKRQEAARKAEEERLARERAAVQPLTLEQLEIQAAALRAKMIEQQSHLRAETERAAVRGRITRLAQEIDADAEKLSAKTAELAQLKQALEQLG